MPRALLFLLLLSPLSARAQEESRPLWRLGSRATFGTGGYVGRGLNVQYGDLWRVRGSYADYDFDGSTGTTRTIAVRGSYQGESLSVGANVSVTPRNDSYANRAFGLDGSWTFLLDDSEEPAGLEDAELGLFWTQTRHSQIVPATPVLPQERNVVINQHDLGVSAAVSAWDFALSLDAYRSVYDQDFGGLPAAVRRRPRLTETAALVNGFPERGGSARLEYGRWPLFTPYVAHTVVRYMIQPQPNSGTTTGGAAMRWRGLGLDAFYELVRQKGSDDTKYFGLTGAFRF